MDAKGIVQAAIALTNTTEDEITLSKGLLYLNLIKDNFWSGIVHASNEDYNWDEWKSDTVINQSEYLLPEVSSALDGSKKIKTLAIAYENKLYGDGGLVYIPATLVDRKTLLTPNGAVGDWDYFKNNQDPSKLIYYVSDKSVFIAPFSSTAIVGGLKLTGLKKIPNYTIDGVDSEIVTTTEEEIRIPVDYFDTLIQGLFPYIFRQLGGTENLNRAITEDNVYKTMKKEAIANLGTRVTSAFINTFPNDRNISSQDEIISN